ncbi:hypothetical protein KIN20_033869 [Parelaphostrongylus tenuis]|uniref:Uncharacterized protein n=1 Tax=Parelaphostrongylus tenuis TaxID=148309 RepID=A0AAD5R9A9_PARTN|nr:hypothetical protein KIN20_033869 [Parelaphostrongylus tenuis]
MLGTFPSTHRRLGPAARSRVHSFLTFATLDLLRSISCLKCRFQQQQIWNLSSLRGCVFDQQYLPINTISSAEHFEEMNNEM